MKKLISIISIIVAMVACTSQKEESNRLSIFCDHITSIAEQENITFAEAASKVRELGVEGVDIDVRIKPEDLASLKDLEFQFPCAIFQPDFTHDDCTPQVEKAVNFVTENNIKNVLLVTGLFFEEPTEEEYDALVRRVQDLIDRMEPLGVKVLIEDYDNAKSPTYNTECIDKLMSRTTGLYHDFDSGNYLYAGEDVMGALEHFIDKVAHVHLKDRRGIDDMSCPPVGD